jgi:hypothetical protein
MTNDREVLTEYKEFEEPQKVALGDGRAVEALGIGRVQVNMLFKLSNPKKCTIYDVLYVPKLTCNLFSVRAAAMKGNFIKFGQTSCWIRNKLGELCGMGSLAGKLYQLNCEFLTTESVSVASESSDINLWHQRLGHMCGRRLKDMVHKEMVTGVKIQKGDEISFCEGCVEGKMHRKEFKPVGEIRSRKKLQLVYSDVCGPMPVESNGGRKYFVTFTDDYSRYCSVYFLRFKSEVLEKFKEFEAMTRNECGYGIKALRSDNGGEYISDEFQNYLKSKGIRHELTTPYSPQQNGVAERSNRTLMESARSMLAHARLPESYWAEAVATAAYIRNRIPTSAIKENKTPFEKWYGRKPDISGVRVFGCVAYAHVPDVHRQKLDKKATKLRFVGYSKDHKGYRLMDEKTSKVIVRRDVVFNEADFNPLMRNEQIPKATAELEEVSEDTVTEDEIEMEQQEPIAAPEQQEEEPHQQRTRNRRPPIRFGRDEYADTAVIEHTAYSSQVMEPTTLKEALSGCHKESWRNAVESEYSSLIENETWELVKLPAGRKPIGCKWVFKLKYGSNGEIERFKGRLVAKGYAQRYGVDYDETYAPVVRFSTIRAVLAFAVKNDMLIHQMDVVTAFLNGKLDEEIYMEQPEGYRVPGKEDHVCKLKKSLYGLKQSPRCWNAEFTKYMRELKFTQSGADSCVFIQNDEELSIIAVYVDDLIIITSTNKRMKELKQLLASQFKMKDMGELHYCLGINIHQDKERKCILLHQKHYIEQMIERFGLSEAKTVSTPADVNVKLTKNDGVSKPVDPSYYQSIVGSLLYASIATRPDIAQAVRAVSRFNSYPTEAHLTAAKSILRYLKGTVDLTLRYKKSDDAGLVGYSDADYAGNVDDRHSTTGNIFFMSGGPVSWLSKKQPVVALSTSEAEYVALSMATQEATWLRRLLSELNAGDVKPTLIYEDNQGAIAIAKNPVAHSKMKHIDVKYHYVREAIQNKIVTLEYCPTEDMLADLLTKPLFKGRFEKLRVQMGLNFET